MKIRQYKPAFFEGFETEAAEFSTIEELEAIPFVKRHTNASLTLIPAASGHWSAFSFTVAHATPPEVHSIAFPALLFPSLR